LRDLIGVEIMQGQHSGTGERSGIDGHRVRKMYQIRLEPGDQQGKLAIVPGISAQRALIHVCNIGLQAAVTVHASGSRQLRLPWSNNKVHPGDLWTEQEAPDKVECMALNPGDLRRK
jgi:hypothetical protein